MHTVLLFLAGGDKGIHKVNEMTFKPVFNLHAHQQKTALYVS